MAVPDAELGPLARDDDVQALAALLERFRPSLYVTLAGYGLGSHISNVDHHLLPIIAVIIMVSLIPIAIEILRSHRNAQAAQFAWGQGRRSRG